MVEINKTNKFQILEVEKYWGLDTLNIENPGVSPSWIEKEIWIWPHMGIGSFRDMEEIHPCPFFSYWWYLMVDAHMSYPSNGSSLTFLLFCFLEKKMKRFSSLKVEKGSNPMQVWQGISFIVGIHFHFVINYQIIK